MLWYLFCFLLQNDKDDIDNIIEEVNAISSCAPQHAVVEKASSKSMIIYLFLCFFSN